MQVVTKRYFERRRPGYGAQCRCRPFWEWLAMGLMAAVMALAVAACQHENAEQQVRSAIVQAADAARERDASALGRVLSADFVNPGQQLDRARLLGLLRLARLRGESVKVLVGPVDIEHRGKRMLARFTLTLGGGGGLIPRHLGVYRVESGWREEDGAWRCYNARWQKAL